MKIEIPVRKLEDTIMDLNTKGYTVKKSEMFEDRVTLTAKKIKVDMMPHVILEIIPEVPEKIFHNNKHKNFHSLWHGFRASLLHFH